MFGLFFVVALALAAGSIWTLNRKWRSEPWQNLWAIVAAATFLCGAVFVWWFNDGLGPLFLVFGVIAWGIYFVSLGRAEQWSGGFPVESATALQQQAVPPEPDIDDVIYEESKSRPVVAYWHSDDELGREHLPIVERLASAHGDALRLFKLEVPDHADWGRAIGVEVYPSIVVFYREGVIDTVRGAAPEDVLREKFAAWAAKSDEIYKQIQLEFPVKTEIYRGVKIASGNGMGAYKQFQNA